MPDRNLVEEVAADLGTRPGLVEKDWHVVRAIGVIARVEMADAAPEKRLDLIKRVEMACAALEFGSEQ